MKKQLAAIALIMSITAVSAAVAGVKERQPITVKGRQIRPHLLRAGSPPTWSSKQATSLPTPRPAKKNYLEPRQADADRSLRGPRPSELEEGHAKSRRKRPSSSTSAVWRLTAVKRAKKITIRFFLPLLPSSRAKASPPSQSRGC